MAALAASLAGCGAPPVAGEPALGLAIEPSAAEAAPGDTQRFVASLDSTPTQAIAWSVVQPGGGTIDASGLYTAPATAGTYHVVATSVADPSVSATATVVVTARPGLPGTPPSDGTTRWAPAAGDTSWVSVKDFGAVGDAVADDTAAFRNAAATGKKLFVPKPAVAYKLTGFVTLKNSIYGDGSMPELRMYGADGDPDQGHTRNMFYVSNYQGAGLVFQGLHLNGQWSGGTNGEWGHVINIGSSSNVTVQHCDIERAYGDDIFVGEYANPMSNNIVIQNNTLRTARRCNVALDGATNVTIKNNQIIKTSSTYVSAIDLEPDDLGFQYVRGVKIDGNVFDVIAQDWNTGAISLNNPASNPASGDVSVTNNSGTWSPVAGYMDIVPGSGSLVGIVPHQAWYNVTASNNVRQ